MNASSMIEVSSGLPLEFQDLSIDLDADSFVWTMGCTVMTTASMNQIRPSAAGPAEVDVTVNGYVWRFIIESYSVNHQFAKKSFKVTGVSRHQLLAKPYAPTSTGRIDSQSNAYQVMAGQLQFTGFSVTRQTNLTDYVIPAGAWGWEEKTPLEVISELASAQGAILVPDREQDIIHVKHRYKQIGPWDYAAQEPVFVDVIVVDTLTMSYTGKWEPNPEYDVVLVSGITDGVATTVQRADKPGTAPAPDIFDDLNVESTQCRERGLTELSASGDQEIVTLELPLMPSGAPGLIEPGMILEYREDQTPANNWRGNVLGVSLSVTKPGTARVKQTVKVERHHYA
jgi:hypothetical protein